MQMRTLGGRTSGRLRLICQLLFLHVSDVSLAEDTAEAEAARKERRLKWENWFVCDD